MNIFIVPIGVIFSQNINPSLNIDTYPTNGGCSLGDLSLIDTTIHVFVLNKRKLLYVLHGDSRK